MEFGRTMNTKYLAVVAALAVMLVAATALATTDSAFATKYKSKSQAVAHGFMSENVWCQNTALQIQGDDNHARLASSQGPHEDGHGNGGNYGGGNGGDYGGGGEGNGYSD